MRVCLPRFFRAVSLQWKEVMSNSPLFALRPGVRCGALQAFGCCGVAGRA